MAADWNKIFTSWAQSPGKTEADRIENSIRGIRKAMSSSPKLSGCTKVFLQGSYGNRVNARADSNVDVGVLYSGGVFIGEYPTGFSRESFGYGPGSYTQSTFKNDVEQALVDQFGRPAVKRGNKALDVKANTYRVEADVVPVFEHRSFRTDGSYICGVNLRTDKNEEIVNWHRRIFDLPSWPDQHYENGLSKNNRTNRRYRGQARIVKKLRVEMESAGSREAKDVVGFLVECLVYNVPDWTLYLDDWHRRTKAALLYLVDETSSQHKCDNWTEVSGYKWLFKGNNAKREKAHRFAESALDLISR